MSFGGARITRRFAALRVLGQKPSLATMSRAGVKTPSPIYLVNTSALCRKASGSDMLFHKADLQDFRPSFFAPALSYSKPQPMVWTPKKWMLAKQVSNPFQPLSSPVPKIHRAMGFASRRLLLVALGAHLCTRCQFVVQGFCIFSSLTKSCIRRGRNLASVPRKLPSEACDTWISGMHMYKPQRLSGTNLE